MLKESQRSVYKIADAHIGASEYRRDWKSSFILVRLRLVRGKIEGFNINQDDRKGSSEGSKRGRAPALKGINIK